MEAAMENVGAYRVKRTSGSLTTYDYIWLQRRCQKKLAYLSGLYTKSCQKEIKKKSEMK